MQEARVHDDIIAINNDVIMHSWV